MKRAEYLGVAFLAVTAGLTQVQAQDRLSGRHLVTIEVAEDRPYTLAHTIRIEADASRAAQSRRELEGRSWRAFRTSERGEQVVSSEDCPALRQAVDAFAFLPLANTPPAMRVHDGPLPMPPAMKDGYSTRLTFGVLTADGSEAVIELSGGNVYRQWANQVVSSLIACWGPLQVPTAGRRLLDGLPRAAREEPASDP